MPGASASPPRICLKTNLKVKADRVGNMTLMQTGANRDAGNAPFAEKKPAYAASLFAITQKVATDNADWTPERLTARQSWMANQASSIWRITQLS